MAIFLKVREVTGAMIIAIAGVFENRSLLAKKHSSLVKRLEISNFFFFSEDIEILLREKVALCHELDSNQHLWATSGKEP